MVILPVQNGIALPWVRRVLEVARGVAPTPRSILSAGSVALDAYERQSPQISHEAVGQPALCGLGASSQIRSLPRGPPAGRRART